MHKTHYHTAHNQPIGFAIRFYGIAIKAVGLTYTIVIYDRSYSRKAVITGLFASAKCKSAKTTQQPHQPHTRPDVTSQHTGTLTKYIVRLRGRAVLGQDRNDQVTIPPTITTSPTCMHYSAHQPPREADGAARRALVCIVFASPIFVCIVCPRTCNCGLFHSLNSIYVYIRRMKLHHALAIRRARLMRGFPAE